MNAIQKRHEILKSMETPVLVAWVRRSIDGARAIVAAEVAAKQPARDIEGKIVYASSPALWCAEKGLEEAAEGLAALLADKGRPVTVRTEPADFGGSSFTFSREQKASDAIDDAAGAIAQATHRKGQMMDSLVKSILDSMYDDLTRNIGIDA